MKPVLTVEGKQYEAEIFSFGYCDENGKYHAIPAEKVEKVEWHGRYDELHKEIEKEIEAKNSQMTTLAIENMHNQQPFTPNDTQKKYFDLLNQQIGLMDAQEVVEIFMGEDVDLSGGEEE